MQFVNPPMTGGRRRRTSFRTPAPVEALEARVLFSQPPPTVFNVFVAGTAWAQPFKDYMASQSPRRSAEFGFTVFRRHGEYPVRTLPWANLNEITVEFSDYPVSADADDLTVSGLTVPDYPVTGVRIRNNTATTGRTTITWTLGRPLGNDRIRLHFKVGPDGVNIGGYPIDGDGDGTLGGDFTHRFDVLAGDVDGGSDVSPAEFVFIRRQLFRVVSPLPYLYDIRSDLDGSGRIDSRDLLVVRRNTYAHLPYDPPPATANLFSASGIRESPVSDVLAGAS